MLRINLFALRPLGQSAFAQASRQPPGLRLFSTLRPNAPSSHKRAPFPSSRHSRTFLTDAQPVARKPSQTESWVKFGISAATVAGTMVGVNFFLNRETRDALSPAERSYLHESFQYTGAGLAFTALAARAMFRNGFAVRLMAARPLVVLGVSCLGSMAMMFGAMSTSPENPVLKHSFWLGFNACQAAVLSPLYFFSPALLSRAALYTVGVVGSLSYIGATAKNDTYLYMGGPLLAGVTVVALSSLAPLALPLGMRGLAVSEAISLYGGLAVFSGFVLFDTQKILRNARLAAEGRMVRDPLKESIGLELDMINIFVRMVQLLANQKNNRK
ncbi:Bax inhibitor family protein [Epithele typhae]|uniref:Bax inhibitor family protein n=1 Tax=Epithele typhae TaxID=378194 RepID=UPI002007C929|nr:Bax inhibitor family protein [Epithele typhae]KAH9944280.1 Bax inhibitor family protein [Epithele typhae]